MRHLRGWGFTLVELLIVIGMIVLLATILLPMVSRVQLQARRTAMAADLQVISQALEAYKSDFGDYPRVNRYQHQTGNLPVNSSNNNMLFAVGAQVLCWALVAPGNAAQDGADGPGFRLHGVTGPVKGPYLPPDRFLIGTADGVGVIHPPGTIRVGPANYDDMQDVLADRGNSPILYFPAYKGSNPASSFVAATFAPGEDFLNIPPVFAFDDNQEFLDTSHMVLNIKTGQNVLDSAYGNPANLTRGANEAGWKVMAYRLGDINYNGTIDNAEVAITTGPFLLWTAGPDMIFGNDDDVMCDGTQLQQIQGPLPYALIPK